MGVRKQISKRQNSDGSQRIPYYAVIGGAVLIAAIVWICWEEAMLERNAQSVGDRQQAKPRSREVRDVGPGDCAMLKGRASHGAWASALAAGAPIIMPLDALQRTPTGAIVDMWGLFPNTTVLQA